MAENTQPDLQWGPLEQKPDNRRKIWVVAGLAVAALIAVGALLFFLLPKGESPTPGSTPSASAGEPTASPSDEPTEPAVTTAPEPQEPSVDEFRAQVEAWLSDAARGLDIVAGSTGEDSLSAVGILQEDALRLGSALPPSSIADEWREGVSAYSASLDELKNALSQGSDSSAPLEAARGDVVALSELVGS
ncbi:hypothetical protein [Microbacterium hydrocarbonoxydans]|uniref:hypothetical protein n=1 Tax=Microbacterium hydrocarbonoxydans TaxID=273678 RepID=UPI00203DA401|nr:hypothetical protein [Microbacterium hydrocarbonoxydans]MCM3779303.1 hypothetical protein [Microbacterium hydrocarbonoxydans]